MKTTTETLRELSAGWVQDGLITAAQREAILARQLPEPDGHSRFVTILATIGGVLFAVGVSLVIKSNWAAIGDWVKIGALVVLLVGAYGVGWKLKLVDGRYAKTGDASLMVGGILFLCGIALVSQIFHLNSRPASGVLLWWLGIVALPWLARARGTQFLSLVAALVWLGMEMGTPDSWIALTGGMTRYAPPMYRFAVVYCLLGLALWWSGVAIRNTRWSDFAGMHEKWGLALTGGALFWLGFVRHDPSFRHGRFLAPDAPTLTAVGLAAVLALAAVVAAWRRQCREVRSLVPWIAPTLVPLVGIMAIGALGDDGWLWSGLAWLTLFVLSVAVVRTGLQTAREGWVNLGVLLLGANIIARYFDLFGNMLEGGVFFIVTGVMITGLGIFLEKKRRGLVAGLRGEVAS